MVMMTVFMICYILLQLTEAVATNGMQDTEKILEELRNTLKEVEKERYKYYPLYMLTLHRVGLLCSGLYICWRCNMIVHACPDLCN